MFSNHGVALTVALLARRGGAFRLPAAARFGEARPRRRGRAESGGFPVRGRCGAHEKKIAGGLRGERSSSKTFKTAPNSRHLCERATRRHARHSMLWRLS